MELELVTLFALFGVALVAGFIDAIAGGGGLLTVPALLATGMPPAMPLPQATRSGTMPRCEKPNGLPVRPKPAWTSSKIITALC